MAYKFGKVTISDGVFEKAMTHSKTRAALRAEAEKRQAKAEAIAQAEGEKLDSKVTEGTRPKGRPFARVSSTNIDQEYGTTIKERKRILGRAAEG